MASATRRAAGDDRRADAAPAAGRLDRKRLVNPTRILTEAIGAIREHVDRLADVGTVTVDLLHGIVATSKNRRG